MIMIVKTQIQILHYKELLSFSRANVFHQQKLIRRNTHDEVYIYPKY